MEFNKQILIDEANKRHAAELKRIDGFIGFYNHHKTDRKHFGMNIFLINTQDYLMVSFDVYNYTMTFIPITVGKKFTYPYYDPKI